MLNVLFLPSRGSLHIQVNAKGVHNFSTNKNKVSQEQGPETPGSTNIAVAGKWGPGIESMYFLLKMGIFQPASC